MQDTEENIQASGVGEASEAADALGFVVVVLPLKSTFSF